MVTDPNELMRHKPFIATLLTLLSVTLFSVTSQATETIRFAPEDILGWEKEKFEGETRYELTEVDGESALHAICDNSASGLYLEQSIDLEKTPVIEWRWRIRETFGPDIDETRKSGDDYPVRLYVVKDGGWRRWRTQAVNYVWASGKEIGSEWPNAYTSRARMVAVQSGEEKAGEWVTQRRNLADDFEQLHGERPKKLDAIAIMSDCDDLETRMEAWYGEIRLLPAD